jgi:hypothetical protein
MATTLTTDNIVEVPDRTEMTTVEDTDNFLVYDVSEDIIKKITKSVLTEVLGVIGVGQTWNNVKTSRDFDTIYTNDTGRPIQVAITCYRGDEESNYYFYINDVEVCGTKSYDYSGRSVIALIVPAGDTYKLTTDNGLIGGWWELR